MYFRVLVILIFSLAVFTLLTFKNGGTYDNTTGFVTTSGMQFVVNDRLFYPNGFNAYWLMALASDPAEKGKVSSALQQAYSLGLSVVRTWAFSDGGYRPLQYSPGVYNEEMFKGLDFVIAEAKKYGIYLILSLVNNDEDFGGKRQYVEWATDQGQYLSSDDDFYTNNVVKEYYKNHVKTILTRNNSVTGDLYKDDPTIFAWELMNEPRCESDISGKIVQDWVTEMAAYVKSIDSRHLLEVGLEGFYGQSMPQREQYNPGYGVGTDFVSNNQIPGIDFATIHAYPDQWLPELDDKQQISFLRRWIRSHIHDSREVLKKPLVIAEFGESLKLSGYTESKRDVLYATVYNAIYESTITGGPFTGGLFWQLLLETGMDGLRDGYEIILSDSSSTTQLILQQSQRILLLNNSSYIFTVGSDAVMRKSH